MAPRKTSDAGIALIKRFEGCRLKAYKCPAGVWTVGYGSTGPDVREGVVVSAARAEELLREDLRRFEAGVARLVTIPLLSNQHAALVCFAYNVGLGNLCESTLLKKLNRGDYRGAADEFLKWTKAGGRELPGLVKRRAAERELFLAA